MSELGIMKNTVISGNTGIGENREEQKDRIGNVITIEIQYTSLTCTMPFIG